VCVEKKVTHIGLTYGLVDQMSFKILAPYVLGQKKCDSNSCHSNLSHVKLSGTMCNNVIFQNCAAKNANTAL
jgi:hypothetical protein